MGLLLGDIIVRALARLNLLCKTPSVEAVDFSPHSHKQHCYAMQYNERGESMAQVHVALPQIRAERRKVGCTAWHLLPCRLC